MKKEILKNKKGFTLIEVMIATTIFVTVILIGMGSILSVYKAYQVNRGMRDLIENVNAIMEDMSRNIRLGRNFECAPGGDDFNATSVSTVKTYGTVGIDCVGTNIGLTPVMGGYSLRFTGQEGDGSIEDTIVYSIHQDIPTSTDSIIRKSIVGGANQLDITIPGVIIDNSKSGFVVKGAGNSDSQHPYILIRLVGIMNYRGVIVPFNLQNTVSPRDLDINI